MARLPFSFKVCSADDLTKLLAAPAAWRSPSVTGAGSAAPHFLHAGQVHVSSSGEPILLILGSCVAVCIWDSLNAIGGATHYLLPVWDGRGSASPRYGNVAIGALLERLTEAGAQRARLRAKVFGGACLFNSTRAADSDNFHLGKRNVQMALEVLSAERIPVVSVDAGKDQGLRIVFHTGTGESSLTTLAKVT